MLAELFDLIEDGNTEELETVLTSAGDASLLRDEDGFTVSDIFLSLSGTPNFDRETKTKLLRLFLQKTNVDGLTAKEKAEIMNGCSNGRGVEAIEVLLSDSRFDPNFRGDNRKDAFTTAAEQSYDKADGPPVAAATAAARPKSVPITIVNGDITEIIVGEDPTALSGESKEKYLRERELLIRLIATNKLHGLTNPALARFAIFAISNFKADGRPFITMHELRTILPEETGAEIIIPKSFTRLFSNRERMESILAHYPEGEKAAIRTTLNATYHTYREESEVRTSDDPITIRFTRSVAVEADGRRGSGLDGERRLAWAEDEDSNEVGTARKPPLHTGRTARNYKPDTIATTNPREMSATRDRPDSIETPTGGGLTPLLSQTTPTATNGSAQATVPPPRTRRRNAVAPLDAPGAAPGRTTIQKFCSLISGHGWR